VIRLSIRTGESPERFIQRFKRLCTKEGVIREIKKRAYYEKPSERRRRREKEERQNERRRTRLLRVA
jgi:small subunit ribosomal protein S21